VSVSGPVEANPTARTLVRSGDAAGAFARLVDQAGSWLESLKVLVANLALHPVCSKSFLAVVMAIMALGQPA
jgi:hypothetical protein